MILGGKEYTSVTQSYSKDTRGPRQLLRRGSALAPPPPRHVPTPEVLRGPPVPQSKARGRCSGHAALLLGVYSEDPYGIFRGYSADTPLGYSGIPLTFSAHPPGIRGDPLDILL